MLKQLCLIASMVVLFCTIAVANTRPSEEMVSEIAGSITYCESHNQHDGTWGRAGEYGIAQFKAATFDWMSGLYHHPNYDITNKEDQINLLKEALRHGLGNHWRVCYGKAVKQRFAKLSKQRRNLMLSALMGTRSVDTIIASFKKTIDELDNHESRMYAEVAKQLDVIVEAGAKKANAERDRDRARAIRIKIENLLV